MSLDVHICKIISHKKIAPDVYDVTVFSPEIAKAAKPGQFLHIKCGDEISMPLRRPISICSASAETVRFIYQVKGKGTEALTKENDSLDILGPLGHGFIIDNSAFKKPAVIGGGIGAYPLLFLTQQLQNASVFMGFRTKELVTLEDDFKMAAKEVKIATDDGSYGYHGFSIDLLKETLGAGDADIVYCCGPKPMLKAVAELCESLNVKCQVSLEERMGCGIGACLTCSCETKTEGTWKYKRVCKNGPVFWSDEVVL